MNKILILHIYFFKPKRLISLTRRKITFSLAIYFMFFSLNVQKVLYLYNRTMVPFAKNSINNGIEVLIDVETYDYAIRDQFHKTFSPVIYSHR